MKNVPDQKHRSSRGVISVEVTIGIILFFGMISYIFDYGLLIHKRSLLLDLTLKTVQQVTRDPQAAQDRDLLSARVDEVFGQLSTKMLPSAQDEVALSAVEIDCASQQIRLRSEWEAPCLFCFLGKFRKKLNAQSVGLLEVSPGSLKCSSAI